MYDNKTMDGFGLIGEKEDQLLDVEEVSFDYDGYQVVRGEFFSHLYEPSFSFSSDKVYVNAACLKKLPRCEYVQILVNPDEYKLAVRPCSEDERDSFRWCSNGKRRAPKQITCRMFFAKVMSLMEWNPDYRYKLLGKLIRSNSELLFVFDLNSPEIYVRRVKEDGKARTTRTPIFPEEWKNQFGISYREHQETMRVGTFDGYTVFSLTSEKKKRDRKEAANDEEREGIKRSMPSDRPEEEQDPHTQVDPAPSGGPGVHSVPGEPVRSFDRDPVEL